MVRWDGACLRGIIAVCAVAAAGCVGAAELHNRVAARVSAEVSLADTPVDIQVSGLAPGTLATLRLRSVDAHAVAWSSSAEFRAGPDGSVDPASSPALSGSYTGRSAMGLVWSMQPAGPAPDTVYFWRQNTPLAFHLTVTVNGRARASLWFTRRFSAAPISAEPETIVRTGFYGEFFTSGATPKRPALLVIGGSEGGIGSAELVAAMLAAHGHPALALAYFKEPGLPPALSRIPLEYFTMALTWLRHRPGVDPSHVLVLGISRGSEAALLLGAYFPNLVHGVVASVPSDAAICSYPGCSGPVWMLHGRPLPYTRQFANPHPTDNPAAVIPVERTSGPIFLDCGGADNIWPSCPYAQAIVRRLAAHHTRYAHPLYAYPTAGHGVGRFVPYEPEQGATGITSLSGASINANPDARAQLWPALLRFLATAG